MEYILFLKIPNCTACDEESKALQSLQSDYNISVKILTIKTIWPRPKDTSSGIVPAYVYDDSGERVRVDLIRPVLAYPIMFCNDLLGKGPGMCAAISDALDKKKEGIPVKDTLLSNDIEHKNFKENKEALKWLADSLPKVKLKKEI